MKVVVRTDEYSVYLKRNNRHAVRGADRRWINGEEKVRILRQHDLIKAPPPKAPEPAEETVEEAEAEASAAAGEEEGEPEA